MKKELSNNTNKNKLKGILTIKSGMTTRGITLVALVVTIVVLLILAGITISYIMGDNSVFKKASDAKVQTELGKIEERANLIYVDKLMQNVPESLNNKPTMQEVVDELKTEGYPIERIEASDNSITGISLDKENMTLGFGKSNTIKVTLESSGEPYTYYAVVDGKYYQMHYNSGNITIDRTPSEVSSDGEENTQRLSVNSSDETVATATIDNTTRIVTVTAKKEGRTTITVKLIEGSNYSESCEVTVSPLQLADIVDQIQDTNREIEDENGNKITIPGGFKVVPDTEENDVDYSYSGDKKPCVQDGIVIEDAEGNQFVWIPVGEIKNKDGSTTTITLGRYTFNGIDGTPTLKQNGTEYSKTVTISNYFQELTSDFENTASKSLGTFISKTNWNRGYYFGRYEASCGSDGKVDLKRSRTAWKTTQFRAAVAAREMYNSVYIQSDLINSYSWDTAIVFIQKYSKNSNYANRTSFNSSFKATGEVGDKVCNIHDMASNYMEWTTEHSTEKVSTSRYPCTIRGGNCKDLNYTASKRTSETAPDDSSTLPNSKTSFRSLLYLK